jgi:periplasmic mercuric ion binding protein
MKGTKMKKSIMLSLIFGFIALSLATGNSYSQEETTKIKEAKIKTSAICEMCKARIEKAVNRLDGIKKSDLDVESKVLTVSYNPDDITLEKIRETLNRTGYDADDTKADPRGYAKLPKCCKQPENK